MIRKALVAAGVLLVALSIGSVAFAQSDCAKIVPASPGAGAATAGARRAALGAGDGVMAAPCPSCCTGQSALQNPGSR